MKMNIDMKPSEIANKIKALKEKIILIYAFNATGKTRLSVAYKDAAKNDDGKHAGAYYNAFSEDIFIWDNDLENDGKNLQLKITHTRLNQFHSSLYENETFITDKLKAYNPKYSYKLTAHDNIERGIKSVTFFMEGKEDEPIKISRGEERIFVWCFFLALFEVDGCVSEEFSHFFIDDPVSSLDDHNIFITALTLYDLIKAHYKNRKIIITTHHMGLFSTLSDWLTKGEEKERYKKLTKLFILSQKSGELTLEEPKNDVFLYHLHLLQTLEKARVKQLYTFHFALLRQLLENIASFLGAGQFSYVLGQIGINDTNQVARIINALSHQRVYHHQQAKMNADNIALFTEVLDKLKAKYNFKSH